ncbi:T-cell immunomodulatory protein-like isoform X2 [Anneissia japonica]|uniref:T-cell immunomodulatory protein-like isoform X2 n=1 Tax=Anneissia japonica TaxID=1529436 RepID=UPI001425A146|nr:T-cell immunomodulatory protein-like isoform X2 [Anneissia japonica]
MINNYVIVGVKMRVRKLYLCVFVNVLLIFRGVTGEVKNGDLEDFTNSVFKNKNGIIAAFGDFNADQNTDAFVIHPAVSPDDIPKMSILIWHNVEPYLKPQTNLVLNLTRRTGEVITSVVPGDYDGDSKMDVLLTLKNSNSMYDKNASTAALIYWGNLNSFCPDGPTVVSDSMADQPLVMDYNADMIADIFGANAAGERTLWIQSSSGSRNFTAMKVLKNDENQIIIPHSNAFLDLDSDFITDIFLTTSSTEKKDVFEVWKNAASSKYQLDHTYPLPKVPEGKTISVVGQSAFTDVDADGVLEQLLPVCYDEQCHESAIFVRKSKNWKTIIEFKDVPINDEVMGFVPPGPDVSTYANVPITLSIGDYNTDRYPDLLIVMRNQTNSRHVVLLNNNEGESFSPVARMGALWTITNPIIATFVDLSQSTMLDMFVVSQNNPTAPPMMHAVKNNFIVDAYFIRVQVLSGLCFYSCPGFASGTYPYGANQPGPTVHYETTGTSGKKEYSKVFAFEAEYMQEYPIRSRGESRDNTKRGGGPLNFCYLDDLK